MKSIKEIVDAVIDIVHDNTEHELDPYEDDYGRTGYDLNLSPSPACYEKLNAYFAEMYVETMIDMLKSHYNQKTKI